MASTYSADLSIYIADKFRESFATQNVYLTFGYVSPWTNELNPPQANTSVDSFNETWKNMIGGKKITSADIRHAVPRHDWTIGESYMAYDNTMGSNASRDANNAFYVLTDDFNVYKCISNNYGGVSTSKPTSTNPTSQFQTADSYIWKYMYSLTGEEQQRFLTNDYMPVKTLLQNDNSLQWQVQDDAIPGSINRILLTGSGTGYITDDITVTIKGDGRYANAYAVRSIANNNITDIIVDNKGSGYTYANAIITATHGGNATARVVISPPNGHGSDALHELEATYLLLNVRLNGTEEGVLTPENDYRQISIVENPYVYGTSNIMSNLVFNQVTTLTLSESTVGTNYQQDEIVYQGADLANATFRGVVTSWDSANSTLKVTNAEGNPTSSIIIGKDSTASRYISAVVDPDVRPFSGYLLYKDNISVITRAEDQNEDFKIVLSF
jgi:hypothetical protein